MINLLTFLSVFVASTLTITSPAFKNNQMIPSKYSCEGENTSPALHIEGMPTGTKSIALIVHDPDAPMQGGVTHWIAWNIDPAIDIPEKFEGGTQGMNTRQKEGYMGPCPPTGVHHYHFMIYALDGFLTLDKNSSKTDLEKAMEGHILAKGELIGLYRKQSTSN